MSELGVRRAALLLIACAALVGPVTVGWSGAAGAATSGEPPELVFRSNDTASLATLSDGGTVRSLGVDADVAGPMRDFDGDGTLEAPYVNGGDIRLVERDGDTETLASADAPTTNATLAVGDVDGDGTLAVFYRNTADGGVYKVEYGGTPTPVVDRPVEAVAGVADLDGDTRKDVVFLNASDPANNNTSDTLNYYDGKAVRTTGYADVGRGAAVGLGAPVDVDGNGEPRVPVVDGNGTLVLVDAAGRATAPAPGLSDAAKAAPAAVDRTGDSTEELVYVDAGGTLSYVALDGTTGSVTDGNGDAVAATPGVGVADTAPVPGPVITEYSVANPDRDSVTVSFVSSRRLADLQVTVGGPTFTTLTGSDFSVSAVGDDYRYVANYGPDTDGEFTATLQRAEDGNGLDGATGQSGTVEIDVPPEINSYTVLNPDGRTVEVQLSATESLEDIVVFVDGPQQTVLRRSDFVATGANPRTYVARYTPDRDGEYTAKLRTAVDSAGHSAAAGQAESVLVNGPPVISSYSVRNTDGREITVSFQSTERLTGIGAAVTGPETATLDADDFSATDNGDSYRYVAVYTPDTDGTYSATLERAVDAADLDGAGDQSGTVTVDGAPAVDRFSARNPDGQTVSVRLRASEPLVGLGVALEGPEGYDRTVSRSAFDRRAVGDGYRYETAVAVERDGEYTARLETATDDAGHDAASGQVATTRVENPSPRVVGATVTDASDGDGILAGGDAVEVAATVEGERVESVVANLSALGAGTVMLSRESGNAYTATTVVDGADAAAGSFAFAVRAHNAYGNAAGASTGRVLVDAAAPTAGITAGAEAEAEAPTTLSAAGSSDNVGIARYEWAVDGRLIAAGRTITHRFAAAGEHRVELTVVDVAGNRATGTTTVVAANATGNETTGTASPTPGEGVVARDSATADSEQPYAVQFDGVPVRAVVFESAQAGEVSVARHASLPDDVGAYGGLPLVPMTVTAPSADADATVVVTVDRARLRGLDPEETTVSRYHDGEWQAVETHVDATPVSVTYTVRTPGFSAFLVGAPGATPTGTATDEPPSDGVAPPGIDWLKIGAATALVALVVALLLAQRRYRFV